MCAVFGCPEIVNLIQIFFVKGEFVELLHLRSLICCIYFVKTGELESQWGEALLAEMFVSFDTSVGKGEETVFCSHACWQAWFLRASSRRRAGKDDCGYISAGFQRRLGCIRLLCCRSFYYIPKEASKSMIPRCGSLENTAMTVSDESQFNDCHCSHGHCNESHCADCRCNDCDRNDCECNDCHCIDCKCNNMQ